MAKLLVAVCDQCGVQAPLRSTGFGEHDIPVGWILLKQVDGTPDEKGTTEGVQHLCSWACVERYGCIRDGAWRGDGDDAE